MPVDPDSRTEITAFAWVPPFAQGFVRDLRPRWACEEIGSAYADEPWAKLRRPSLLAFAGKRFDRLADALHAKRYLADRFTVADIAMATVLREANHTDLVSSRPALTHYLARCLERPAFKRALAAQLAVFKANPPQGEAA